MKRNLYFVAICQRRNPIIDALLNLFLSISSYPKLLLEVFIRREMGVRYFNLFPVVQLALFLLVSPFLLSFSRYNADWYDTITAAWGWYLFTLSFILCSYLRYRESYSKFGEQDSRYSLSAGKLLPFIKNIKIGKPGAKIRLLETFVEPILVVLVAVVFLILNQILIGMLLLSCSVVYSISYICIYRQGDDFIRDKIDGLLCARDMADAFMHDVVETASGFRFYGYKPDSSLLREELYNAMLVDAEYVSEVTKA